MPLVTISSLPPQDPKVVPRLIQKVRDAGAQALRGSPNNIWVIFQPIPAGYYIQGAGKPASGLEQDSHPPTVIVRAQSGRTPEERTALVQAISNVVAEELHIPSGNVWIYYEEMRPQDVWFEGHWASDPSS